MSTKDHLQLIYTKIHSYFIKRSKADGSEAKFFFSSHIYCNHWTQAKLSTATPFMHKAAK